MWSPHVVGREGWVWDMPTTDWLDMNSSYGVGVGSVSAVCPSAGGNPLVLIRCLYGHKYLVVTIRYCLGGGVEKLKCL